MLCRAWVPCSAGRSARLGRGGILDITAKITKWGLIVRYNTKIAVYPGDNNYRLIYCNRCIFSDTDTVTEDTTTEDTATEDTATEDTATEDITTEDTATEDTATEDTTTEDTEEFCMRSIKRAKDKIFDIVCLNCFKYFFTITFDSCLVDSTDVNLVLHKLRVWLTSQQQCYGIGYLLVPEYHKNGGIHCHMLVTDYPSSKLSHAVKHSKGGDVVLDSHGQPILMYTHNGQPIYNVVGWRYGYSTCIPIYDNSVRLAHYITKYITKSSKKIFGKYYWSSHSLRREPDYQYCNTYFNGVDLPSYNVPNTNISLKYYSHFSL